MQCPHDHLASRVLQNLVKAFAPHSDPSDLMSIAPGLMNSV